MKPCLSDHYYPTRMAGGNEMYERGVMDAEQNDFNPFYYQHYFYYRQGYDAARRRLHRAAPPGGSGRSISSLLMVLVLAAFAGGAVWFFLTNPPASGPASAPTLAAAAPTALPTAPSTSAPAPSSAPSPSAVPALQVGGRARVTNVGDTPLRARRNPGLSEPVRARFPEGAEVTILEGPREVDGFVWWRIEASGSSGWSAERGPEGAVWLTPIAPTP